MENQNNDHNKAGQGATPLPAHKTLYKQVTAYYLFTTFLLLGTVCLGQTSQNPNDKLKTSVGKVSECLTNCNNESEVISSVVINNELHLKIGAHLNCSVNSSSEIFYTSQGDTLNISIQEFQIKRDTIVSKTDSSQIVTISETQSSAECKCFFHIDLVINTCKNVPKTILINGLTLAENYRRRTIIITK